MKFNPPSKWFGPKRFGWGIGPRSWEGWVITAIVVVALTVIVATTTG